MDCSLNNTFFTDIQNSGLAHIIGTSSHRSQLLWNLPNPSQRYSKRQTRDKEVEMCLVEGLEPTYYFSIFNRYQAK